MNNYLYKLEKFLFSNTSRNLSVKELYKSSFPNKYWYHLSMGIINPLRVLALISQYTDIIAGLSSLQKFNAWKKENNQKEWNKEREKKNYIGELVQQAQKIMVSKW